MDNKKTQIEFKSRLYYPTEYNVNLSLKTFNSCSFMNKGFIFINKELFHAISKPLWCGQSRSP